MKNLALSARTTIFEQSIEMFQVEQSEAGGVGHLQEWAFPLPQLDSGTQRTVLITPPNAILSLTVES
jgi:hypothetical protein